MDTGKLSKLVTVGNTCRLPIYHFAMWYMNIYFSEKEKGNIYQNIVIKKLN